MLGLVGAELAFVVYCLATRSNQVRVRSLIRIAGFTGFVSLALSPAIDWSARYYALGAVLLLLATFSAVTLINRRVDRKPFRARYIVLRSIWMTLLIVVVALPAVLFPDYKLVETTGAFSVATATYTYTDTRRIETYSDTGEHRKLAVGMWYPDKANGTYPLIVFSHGSFGTVTSNESLYNELASHGYVVCAIGHTYQASTTTLDEGRTVWMDRSYAQEVSAENAMEDRQQSFEYYQKWMSVRTGDISFVIDTILAAAGQDEADQGYKLVDPERIGVMGHSLGGAAALGIGRMRADVDAVIALESPFMCDIQGVQNGEFVWADEPYPVPVLNVYSDQGWDILASRPQYAMNQTLLSDTTGTAFNVHIGGTGHLSLTDLSLSSPLLTRILNGRASTTEAISCLQTINQLSLEFFDCFLKGEGSFQTK